MSSLTSNLHNHVRALSIPKNLYIYNYIYSVPGSIGNTKITKKTNGTLVLGCKNGYRFSDGSMSKTIPSESDCKTLTDWLEIINSNHTCYRKYAILYLVLTDSEDAWK